MLTPAHACYNARNCIRTNGGRRSSTACILAAEKLDALEVDRLIRERECGREQCRLTSSHSHHGSHQLDAFPKVLDTDVFVETVLIIIMVCHRHYNRVNL